MRSGRLEDGKGLGWQMRWVMVNVFGKSEVGFSECIWGSFWRMYPAAEIKGEKEIVLPA